MTFYRRRLPHIYEVGQPVFLTWRLHDSLPPHRIFPKDALTRGHAFAAMDRLRDETRTGVFYLRQPAVADMIEEAIQYNATILGHYRLHAFAIMPNHPWRRSYQDMHPRLAPDGASDLVSGASASAPAEALETNWLRRNKRGHF